jgi:hypothetical protein
MDNIITFYLHLVVKLGRLGLCKKLFLLNKCYGWDAQTF